jgi:hypothetical protein
MRKGHLTEKGDNIYPTATRNKVKSFSKHDGLHAKKNDNLSASTQAEMNLKINPPLHFTAHQI